MGVLQLVGTAFLVGLSGAMAPGSLLVVIITEVARNGFWAGPVAVVGHAILELVMTILLVRGLGAVLSQQHVLGIVASLGGITLAWFGYLTLKAAPKTALTLAPRTPRSEEASDSRAPSHPTLDQVALDHSNGTSRMDPVRTAIAGMVASLSNPYWILWWATIGATYVASGIRYGKLGPYGFYAGHISSDFVWYAAVSWAVVTGKRFLNDKSYRIILSLFSAFMILLGAYFVKEGLSFLFAE